MDIEHLNRVEEVFHALMEAPPDERATLLDELCGTDLELRREVESLLEYSETPDNFIDEPPALLAAQVLAERQGPSDLIGRQVGSYVIRKLLGSGGMGHVFLADDLRLDRKVGLKLLHENVAADGQRRRRFELEARAASALNHPNILTIFEFGKADGKFFLATELVEGDTLRDLVSGRSLSLTEAIGIAEQTALALAAAHRSGIVHRDIKPENIMRRRDGIVKILDFGLAKLIEVPQIVSSGSPSKEIPSVTTPGLIMGTAAYMSPEQARGLADVDARTDVWSLGVLLYEMVSGRVPFTGRTTSDVIAAILRAEPEPLGAVNPGLPNGLDVIIGRALTKDRDRRYQTAEDMLRDLRQLEGELTQGERTGLSEDPLQVDADRPYQTGESYWTETAKTLNAISVPDARAVTGSVPRAGGFRWAAASTVLVLLVGMGALGLTVFLNARQDAPASGPSRQLLKYNRVATSGLVSEAAISPDGRTIAYLSSAGARKSLYAGPLESNSAIGAVPVFEGNVRQLAFSPDGKSIYFTMPDEAQPQIYVLFRLPLSGGNPEMVLRDVDTTISFNPDGTEFVFGRGYPDEKKRCVIVARTDGSAERIIGTRSWTDGFGGAPAWSPDGKTIATFINEPVDDVLEFSLTAIDVASGAQSPIGTKKWRWQQKIAWTPDGKEILLVVQDVAGEQEQLWKTTFPDGEYSRITNDFRKYESVQITADGATLLVVQSRQELNIYVGSAAVPASAKQITSIEGLAYDGIAWTPDGRIVYGSNASGSPDIWIMNSDGSGQAKLTDGGVVRDRPSVSPDGRYIVYRSENSTKGNIWRMNIDGSEPVKLTAGGADFDPVVSADSRWVIYSGQSPEGINVLYRVPIEGGEPVRIIQNQSVLPSVSPDGRYLATSYYTGRIDTPAAVTIFPADGGTPLVRTAVGGLPVRWAPDSKSLVYPESSQGNVNLMAYPVDGSPEHILAAFDNQQIFDLAYSPDGHRIALVRGTVNKSLVLITNFK